MEKIVPLTMEMVFIMNKELGNIINQIKIDFKIENEKK